MDRIVPGPYPYDPALSAPPPPPRDYRRPGEALRRKLVRRREHAQVRSWRPPEGVAVHRFVYPGADRAAISCWSVAAGEAAERRPGVLYFHGGAFLFALEPMMLENAAWFAAALGVRVFLPEYRLAPEHPFPTPLLDCFRLLQFLSAGNAPCAVDPDRLLLYGESAGGCLAAGTALLARDGGGPPLRGQALIYPVLDRTMACPSHRLFPAAPWPPSANRQAWELYLRRGAGDMAAYASPLSAQDLSRLPPAYVESQEFDILRDEAEAYVRRLRSAGVAAQLWRVPGSYHGFDADRDSPLVRQALERRVRAMAAMLDL